MENAEIVAWISAGAAAISTLLSMISIFIAGKASNLNKKMFKRQGIIDLHMAWHGVNDIDLEKPICPDIIKAFNALELTSSLWNHDALEKIILYQSYWEPFRNIYDKLYHYTSNIVGLNKSGKSLLTREITKAYEDMKKIDLSSVKQTTL